ncbi:beta strand repeat-containing protein, partial [Tenacibaculum amylolyticum]|uniref:beta strand repeat-containing protein n=1 Tax=Tenacibaculum amylolyticum TaxID=104269 RepID=UPI0038B4E9C6
MKKKYTLFIKLFKLKEVRGREPDKALFSILFVLFSVVFFVNKSYGQYSSTHYVPPYVSGVQASNTQDRQFLILSTLETSAFQVNITLGDGSIMPSGQLLAGSTGTTIITSGTPTAGQYNSTTGVASISASNPLVLRIGVRFSDAVAGTGVMTTNDINSGTGDLNASVTPDYANPSNQGLILSASNNFYVNMRHDSGSQGGSLSGKGSVGLGQSFITGNTVMNGIYDQGVTFISVMATQPGTTNVTFTDFNGRTFIGHGSATTINKTLTQGESYVIAQVIDGDGSNTAYDTAAERNSYNGISVTSDQDIVVASGGLGGVDPTSSSRDIGYDQLVPVSEAGSDFILVRGQGTTDFEYAIVVATQANTQVFLNGSGTAVTTLTNAGDYILLNGTNSLWQSALDSNNNAYIRTDKPSFVYQTTNGANANNVSSMNLIPPISLCSETSEVTIAEPLQFGTAYLNIAVPVGTNTTVTPTGGGTAFVIGPDVGDDIDNSTSNVTGNTEWFTHTYQIPAGVTSINIKGNGDDSIGATNPINVGFLGASGAKGAAGYFAGFGAPPNATIDAASIMLGGVSTTTLTEPADAGSETAVSFSFEVEITGNCTSNVSVDWEVLDGTATLGADYTISAGTTSGTASFTAPSGTSTQTITLPNITVKDDSDVESSETLIIRLSNPVNAVLGTTDTEITILDNDTSVAIAATDAVKAEGNSGNTAFTFEVTRTGITTGTSSVNYAVTGSAGNPANAADFGGSLPSGVVNFAIGETSKIITINVSGDTVFEPEEEFTVTLSGATGTDIGTTTATGTINNDDPALTVSSPTITEGNSGTSNADITVTLSSPAPAGGTTIYYTVVPGTAVAGVDYTAPPANANIIIPAGSTTGTISIPIIGDTAIESNEMFTVQVTRDLVINAGFQDGTTGWTTVSGTPNCAGTFAFEVNAETSYGGSNAANQVLEVDCLSQGFQDFPTVPGTTYDVSFITSRRTAGGSPASVNATITVQNNNGGVLTNLNNITVTKTNTTFAYTTSTFSFTATGTTSRILFTSTLTQTLGLILDDLSVEPQTADATATVTITDDDTSITLGASPAVCSGTTSASLPYTATGGSPDQYSITYDAAAIGQGFANVTTTALPVSPISLTVPAGAIPATYNGTITVTNSGTGASSTAVPFTVTVNSLPTITLSSSGVNTTYGVGGTVNLPYTATTGSPNQYSITYDAAALGEGFSNVTTATLPASPITITVPASADAATYNATLTVINSTTGCVSNNVPITITVDPKALTVDVTADNKVYDGTTDAVVTLGSPSLVGIEAGDVVTIDTSPTAWDFANANVGTGISVTATTGSYTITGTNAGNYTVTQPSGLTANITAKALTITATDQNKEYGSSLTGG